MNVILGLLLILAVIGLLFTVLRLRSLSRHFQDFAARFRGVTDADAERRRVLEELARDRAIALRALAEQRDLAHREFDQLVHQRDAAAGELQSLQSQVNQLRTEFTSLDEEANLRSFGFYKPHYDFAESQRYQVELERIRDLQKQMLKDKTAQRSAQQSGQSTVAVPRVGSRLTKP